MLGFKPVYADHPLADQITEARIQRAAPETVPHVIGTTVTSVLIYLILGVNANIAASTVWFTAITLNVAAFTALYISFKKQPDPLARHTRNRLNIVLMLMFGLTWGVSPWLFLSGPDLLDAAILMATLFAMCIIGGPTLSLMSFPGFICFFTPMLLGAGIRLFTLGIDIPLLALGLIPFLWLSIYFYTASIYRMFIDSITLRLENEQAYEQAEQANQEKSRFIAAASHDIRQPLQAITYLIERLHQLAPESMQSVVDNLDESTASMTALLDGLLDISRLDAGVIGFTPEPIDIKQFVERLCNEQASVAGLKSLDLNSDIPAVVVNTDPLILSRIMANLVGNAIKYTHEGSVSITASVASAESTLTLRIEDTGIGISEAQIAHIYKEFYQVDNPELNQNKGLGLGLAIVQRLARVADIQLILSSQPGQGTCFEFSLPLLDMTVDNLKPIEQPPSVAVSPLQGLKVLLVEDNSEVRDALEGLLCSWGCVVSAVTGYAQAMAYAESHDACQVLITDFTLPDNQTGADVISQLSAHWGQPLASIIVTGDTSAERIREATQNSHIVLHKPVKPAMLKVAVSRVADWKTEDQSEVD